MEKFKLYVISIFLVCNFGFSAQNITGIINNYAAVSNFAGPNFTVNSAAAFSAGDKIMVIQMKGAEIDTTNATNFGDISDMGGAGMFEFLNIASVTGSVITTSASPMNLYNTINGFVQLVRIPRYCTATVINTLSCASWSNVTGGILAFEVGTLTLNGDIDVSAKGFTGGDFANSSFTCSNGNFRGVSGLDGGEKGESISAYIIGYNGAKGKQANGGGGANGGNSGGGGGGNGGAGGIGGHQYSGCVTYDDRGIGGLGLSPAFSVLYAGAGGGGGFQDNGNTSAKGGNGGGIIYIKANAIISNNRTISSNGGSVTVIADSEGTGGGGAGGTIFIECSSITGNLKVKSNGGTGGSNFNNVFPSDCHGTGGGGGGGVFAFSGVSLPPNVTYTAQGGLPGLVTNPASSCYNTSHGAGPGVNGISLPGLPTSVLNFNTPALTITSPGTICAGVSTTLIAGGASTYSWSTGSTSTQIVVSPSVNTSYTVTGTSSGVDGCSTSSVTSLEISACTGIAGLSEGRAGLKMYPNPVRTHLSVETETTVEIVIYDQTGKAVLKTTLLKGEYKLDLSTYAPGVYLVKATDESGIRQGKLVRLE